MGHCDAVCGNSPSKHSIMDTSESENNLSSKGINSNVIVKQDKPQNSPKATLTLSSNGDFGLTSLQLIPDCPGTFAIIYESYNQRKGKLEIYSLASQFTRLTSCVQMVCLDLH